MSENETGRQLTSRRDFLKLGGTVIAGAALFGLGACGGSSGGASGGGGGTGDVTLSISPDLVDMMKPKLAAFSKANGNTAKIRVMPADTGAYLDRIRTQLEAGSSDIDVIAGDVSWPSQLASNGWIEDLSARFTKSQQDAYLPATVAANVWDGKVVGVPFFTDAGILWYRTDLLERSGYSAAPATWAELQEMALKIKRDAKLENGFVWTGAQYEGGTVLGMEFIRSAGGDILKDGKVVIGEQDAIDGLTIARGLVTSGASPAAVANFKEDETTGAFLGGNAAFMRNWPYVFGLLGDREQTTIDPATIAVAQIPTAQAGGTSVNVGGGWNFFMNANSAKKDTAWELIRFLSNDAQQKAWALEGAYLPTRKALYEDPEIVDAMQVVKKDKEAVFQTTTPPVSPFYADMSRLMAERFNASLRGTTSPGDAAAKLQDDLSAIVAKGG